MKTTILSSPTLGQKINRFFLTLMVFLASYMMSVSVNAQTAPSNDAIQLNANKTAVMTGTVKSADENWVIIDSAGKEMKIVLDKVNLKDEADTVFEPGMSVTVEGELKGDDFGAPLVEASSITAVATPAPQ